MFLAQLTLNLKKLKNIKFNYIIHFIMEFLQQLVYLNLLQKKDYEKCK